MATELIPIQHRPTYLNDSFTFVILLQIYYYYPDQNTSEILSRYSLDLVQKRLVSKVSQPHDHNHAPLPNLRVLHLQYNDYKKIIW